MKPEDLNVTTLNTSTGIDNRVDMTIGCYIVDLHKTSFSVVDFLRMLAKKIEDDPINLGSNPKSKKR